MALPPKVCPECGEEYLHSASVCVHCEVALVLPDELGAAPSSELPPVSELHCLRAMSGDWAVGLSERLREAGIPHRIDPVAVDQRRGNAAYAVWVRPADLERARPIDAAHAAQQIPDLPESFDDDYREATAHAAGDHACPACGERVAPEDSECGSCGLFLGEGEG